MRYLLDTQVIYWMRVRPERLSPQVRKVLESPSHVLWYSIITPWELAIKEARKKIVLPHAFYAALREGDAELLTVNESHVAALTQLPLLHHDPFDRMLVAQAQAEQLTLITADRRLAAYPLNTLIA